MRCPICKREVSETDRDRKGSVYPFCSERCKLIDLGRWLSDKYQVPIAPDDDEESASGPKSDSRDDDD
ncbi:MAG TPA: DNA gyrase inhibitor YacG [Tepidisphaeraceae bacterium]|jgi:hypothetical protein|nr:DNA gyrase inhibitor YacG [Tepidisphaeraceae bacterium]